MKKVIFLILCLGFFMNIEASFLKEQKKFKRVRTALLEKELIIADALLKNNINMDNLNILFVAYKNEGLLELWVKNKNEPIYKLLKTFTICAKSGTLGPKRKKGDYQVPEGFYYIDRFNPASSYYLSLGINYPNTADKQRGDEKDFGGDIFIHGKCVTIGCLPMNDDQIKEIYLYALFANNANQNKIPVYIFPFKMSNKNMKKYISIYDDNYLNEFWGNLQIGYDKFTQTKKELSYKHKQNGLYEF